MASTTVAQLAAELNRSAAALLEQLQSAGVSKASTDDSLTESDKERLLDHKISLVKFFTPAPYPGTAYHEEMQKAGRILSEDWGRYDYGSLLVSPTGMDATSLRNGFDRTYKRFYGLSAIAKRMLPIPRQNRKEHAAYIVANLKTWHFLRKNPSAWGTIS